MAIFSDATITRFQNRAEDEFALTYPCILDRVALDIVSGTSLYQLGNAVSSISRVTWKGTKLDPMTHRDFRRDGFAETQTGQPLHYVFNEVGQRYIRLFPTPNETIAAGSSNLWRADKIAEKCIVEFFSMPDYSTLTIPAYIRRRLLKAYVLKELFAIEGKGKSRKNAKYYTAMYKKLAEDYGEIVSKDQFFPRLLISGEPLGPQNTKRPFTLPETIG